MTTRSTRVAQTTAEAKRDFKKNGPRLGEHEARRLRRGVELEQRAARLRKQEDQRRINKWKREQKERKQRETREQLGVGLATQMVGYSRTQKQMKSGMETFLGLNKTKAIGDKGLDMGETGKKMASGVRKSEEGEQWIESDEDFGLDDLPELDADGVDCLLDDDLDDQALIAMEEAPILTAKPQDKHCEPLFAAANYEVKWVPSTDFVRIHGPVNKALEEVLAHLPTPLIEFLSVDRSVNTLKWSPPLSLLYKINPVGFPPHRLRLKDGCVVSVLRDLETHDGQLGKGALLEVLSIAGDEFECLVLDGKLQGRKVLIIRIPFSANYQNNIKHTFERLQFPIRVSTEHTASKLPPIVPETAPAQVPHNQHRAGLPEEPILLATLRPGTSNLPVFKAPGLPVSRLTKPPLASEPPPCIASLDHFEEYFESGSQIARELSETSPYRRTPNRPAVNSSPETPSGKRRTRAGAACGPVNKVTPDRQSLFSPSSTKYHSTIVPTAASATSHCLGEFGLSTQDVMSFFDDDDP